MPDTAPYPYTPSTIKENGLLALAQAGGGGGGTGTAWVQNFPIFVGRDYPLKPREEYDSDEKEVVVANQFLESIQKWLSPQDQSTNHHIKLASRHKDTTAWILRESIYQEWKERASLLWIDGKPGSGKSVLCSTIIEDIATKCAAGQASMAYFYFVSESMNANENTKKQPLHDLIVSLVSQLSAHSKVRHDILSRLYKDHDNGKKRPSNSDLVYCLKQILFSLPAQSPIYLVIDALDECPDTSGIPPPRDRVLRLLKELVDLHHPNLHLCVTSRPEIDIRIVLEPLTPLRVSLHDQTGQKQAIDDYVKSVVCSDSNMKVWKTEYKELVIKTLSERAEGM